jgi:glycosyltransferase involved in cell wall biosynthesis
MVSVCMATKNGASFVRAQLESILPQLSEEDEVVISDDCSVDNTLEVLASFQDRRLRVLENDTVHGITRNFEKCLKVAQGDYIFLADQDDVWLPHKVEVMKSALNRFDLVMSDCRLVDDRLRTQEHSFYTLNNSGKGLFKNLIKNSYMGCCMAFTRRLRDRAVPFPVDIPIHDFWLGLVAELYFNVHFLPDILLLHRRHHSNASTSGKSSDHSLGEQLGSRYRMIKNLFIHKYYAG